MVVSPTMTSSRSASRRRSQKSLRSSPSRDTLHTSDRSPKAGTAREDIMDSDKSPKTLPVNLVSLPRVLPEPVTEEVNLEFIAERYEELAGVPAQYIRDSLVVEGSRMLEALADVHVQPPRDIIPQELEVNMTDAIAAHCPTHILALYSNKPLSHHQTRQITLHATHDLVLAAHCAHIPHLQPAKVMISGSGRVRFPVVPVCLPSPETFALLQSYLYTLDGEALQRAITPESDVCERGDLLKLARHAVIIFGLWMNASALQVVNTDLWALIQDAWEGTVSALERSS